MMNKNEPEQQLRASEAAIVVPVEVLLDAPSTRVVQVVAPTAMNEGYSFAVTVHGERLMVQVPQGGVTRGQQFQATVVEEGAPPLPLEVAPAMMPNDHSIPTGRWRDNLCDCCTLGCCHPVLCCGFWCHACSIGQLQTRLQLTICAQPTDARPYWSPFKILMIAALAGIVLETILSAVSDTQEKDQEAFSTEYNTLGYIFVMLAALIRAVFVVFLLIILIKTRMEVRRMYRIPERHCENCEDCCCAFWCSCCTVTQMLRHTADYKQYKAGCCSEDGLSTVAPSVV